MSEFKCMVRPATHVTHHTHAREYSAERAQTEHAHSGAPNSYWNRTARGAPESSVHVDSNFAGLLERSMRTMPLPPGPVAAMGRRGHLAVVRRAVLLLRTAAW